MPVSVFRLRSVPLGWGRDALVALRALAIAACCGGAAVGLRAELTLAPLFCDGAVLQCDKPVPVWGTADKGDTIILTFAGQTQSALTGDDGRWIAVLDPMPASATGADLVVANKQATRVVHDVLVGEVWLCSGQSNMSFLVRQAMNAPAEIASAHFPAIRQVAIARQTAPAPTDAVGTSGWLPAIPAHVGQFTAVGYFFARDLHERLGVPVGIIHSSWGGTPIEAWLSPLALASNPAFAVVTHRWQEEVAAYPAAKAAYDAKLAAWTAAEPAARARGEKLYAEWLRQNPKPRPPNGAPGDPAAPAGLFDGMINPLLPYAVRGILWYQGESNTGRPAEYPALFTTLIGAWRAHFGQPDLPFFWVNLAAFGGNGAADTAWASLREAQAAALTLPNTGQAVAIDLGDPANIHPANKQELGRRLALLAKHRVYGLTADDSGPVFESATREGTAMRVRFRNVSSGLVAHDKPPQSLELAGPDHVFHPAQGHIERDTLVVSSPEVKEPVAVRYAWHNGPEANLAGGNGLPVPPFRSDAW